MTLYKTKTKESNDTKISFPIIGIGGSAGSFHAFEKFFLHMPINSGMAFIIVMHLDKSHIVNVSSILQPVTSMPIKEAQDGTLVEPDHIYVIPPGKDMGIHSGHLLLMEASRYKGAHMSIDYFLQSLAEDQWNNAVAIIFSGMGADGETGVRMIKEKLGMAMVQEPSTAEYASMPNTAIKTNMVDYILPPEEMPGKLIQYLNHPAIRESNAESDFSSNNNHTHLQKILMLLRSHTGHDFTLYKKSTIVRRIERRIAFHQLNDYVEYINCLRENPNEILLLFNELLIGVTKFFRDREAFDSLKSKLYPILAAKKEDDPIRVWVAGCSTGEEAYSLAMLLIEYLDTLHYTKPPKLQIFATDLDPQAIDHARSASYFENIVSEVSPERLERFFIKINDGYVVKKEVRELIVFAQHNLIKDAPFTRLDLLCCRNVLIYLTAELQKKIIPVFHYSLNSNGMLFLGPAESVGNFSDSFISLDNKWKFFQRKEGASSLGNMLDFPFHVSNQHTKVAKLQLPVKNLKNPLAETFHKILLESFTPTSLLLNERGDILYINGKTGRFMQISSGEAIFNIHRLAKEELKYALGNALHQVWEDKEKVEVNEIKVKDNNQVFSIGFRVDYINEMPLQDLLLVTFYDRGVLKKKRNLKGNSFESSRDGAVEELEKELIYTKQQLHSTIEQMETSLEELKSTNEELQSTNEELQSTNEEALTTKEEMQSLNEELMTINLQYQNKAEELTQLNNDMKNLLDNTEIGTIFLDNQLNILRFTPQVTKLFNVIPGDVGRSITHIVSNFDYPSLEDSIKEVIEKLVGKELEVSTKKDEWYNLRIMPYRTMDNFISGAVVTFTKITPVKAMENKLKNLRDYAKSMISVLPDASVIVDKDGNMLVVNNKFLQQFHLKEEETTDHSLMEIVHNNWKTTKLDDLLKAKDLTETFIRHDFPGLGLKDILVKIQPVLTPLGGNGVISLITFKNQNSE